MRLVLYFLQRHYSIELFVDKALFSSEHSILNSFLTGSSSVMVFILTDFAFLIFLSSVFDGSLQRLARLTLHSPDRNHIFNNYSIETKTD